MRAARSSSRGGYARRFHDSRPTPPRPTLWGEVLAALRPAVAASVASGGEALAIGPDLQHDIVGLGRAPFPVEGASSDAMAQAFRLQVRALLDVALPARRAAIAAGVLGSIDALEGLISDQLAEVTDIWRRRLGAGD